MQIIKKPHVLSKSKRVGELSKYKLIFETEKKKRFCNYRTVKTLKEAWDIADSIKKAYNDLHKDKVSVVGVYKNH
jgi:hypothetical protein